LCVQSKRKREDDLLYDNLSYSTSSCQPLNAGGALHLLLLQFHEGAVSTVGALQQFLVLAFFHGNAVSHHDDLVGALGSIRNEISFGQVSMCICYKRWFS